MTFTERAKELFRDFLNRFPECSFLFLATSQGLPLLAERAEGREEVFSAYFTSLMTQTKEVFDKLELGEPRSILLVSEKGFFNLIPLNEALNLGIAFRGRTDYANLFHTIRGLASDLRKAYEELGP